MLRVSEAYFARRAESPAPTSFFGASGRFVGVDAHIDPAERTLFTEIYGKFATSQRADVGIGPYMTPANSCCPANFECKAFLQQILNRSYSQIWCTITGGAYQIARRVSTCVRNICKSDSCLNRTAGCTPRPQAPLFSPIFSGKTEKIGPPEARQKRPRWNESPLFAEPLFL